MVSSRPISRPRPECNMQKQQAIATLKQGLAALFPYADPKDDPDRERARDQLQMHEALRVLS